MHEMTGERVESLQLMRQFTWPSCHRQTLESMKYLSINHLQILSVRYFISPIPISPPPPTPISLSPTPPPPYQSYDSFFDSSQETTSDEITSNSSESLPPVFF